MEVFGERGLGLRGCGGQLAMAFEAPSRIFGGERQEARIGFAVIIDARIGLMGKEHVDLLTCRS